MSLPRLIIDGYNVISCDPAYSRLFASDADAARVRLIGDVASFAAGRYRATIVFDATGNPRADGTPHEVATVTVIFSGHGGDADSVVESLAHAGLRDSDGLVVATSDAETQHTVSRRGVRRMSSRGLVREMRESEIEAREHAGGERVRFTVEEALDPATREALFRWARGK